MREFLEKYGLRLLIITTVCAVLISVLSFVSATSGFLQNAVGVLTYPFRSAVTAVATWAEDKQRYYKDYSDLIAENEALRERVAELERDARQAEADRAENALLRERLRGIRVIRAFNKEASLQQKIADATGKRVIAGPVEATALGNIMVQARAAGVVSSLAEMRRYIGRSIETKTYQPKK